MTDTILRRIRPEQFREVILLVVVIGVLAFFAMQIPDYFNPRSVNRLTHRTLDPRSKIPEYKVSACRLKKADGPPEWVRKELSPDDPRPVSGLKVVG